MRASLNTHSAELVTVISCAKVTIPNARRKNWPICYHQFVPKIHNYLYSQLIIQAS